MTAAECVRSPPAATPRSYQCEQTKNGTGCTTKGVCGVSGADLGRQPGRQPRRDAAPGATCHRCCPAPPVVALDAALGTSSTCPPHTPLQKTPETTVLQDLLTYSVKGLSCWAHWAAAQGVQVPQEAYK